MRKYRFILKVTPIEEALKRIFPKIKIKPPITYMSIVDSVGCVSAETIISYSDYPPYDRSAVDGYAVRAEDVSSASVSNPIILKVIGFMHTNDLPNKYYIKENECVEVTTGAPIPLGANAVIMAEYTKRISMDEVEVYSSVPPLGNVSLKGEDVKKNDIIIRKGEIIKPHHVGLLATLNIPKIRVYGRFKAAIFGIGDELTPLGEPLEPGKIISSTKYLVEAYLKEKKIKVAYNKVLPDNLETIKNEILKAAKEVDLVFTTGGTSVGVKDFTIEAVKQLKPEELIHGLAIKPGKPTGVAVLKGKPIFMLSGYPVAALTGLLAIFEPIYYMLYETRPPLKPLVKGKLTRRIYVEPGIRGYVRVRVFRKNEDVFVEPLMLTGSGILSTMIKSNGLLVVPEEIEGFDEGDRVEVEITASLMG